MTQNSCREFIEQPLTPGNLVSWINNNRKDKSIGVLIAISQSCSSFAKVHWLYDDVGKYSYEQLSNLVRV